METHSYEIPETRCGNYFMLSGARFSLLSIGLGAAWFVLWKEISKKGLTSLAGVGTLILRTETD